jgi:molybdate transport system substrate-binding protein
MRKLAAALAGAVLLLAGCGGDATGTSADKAGAGGGGTQTLTVFAAASLQKTFTTLGQQFEQQHAGTKVTFSFAGSSDLVTQIVNGAPADVFAAASDSTMKTVTDAGLTAAAPTTFATNVLQIATAPGNPKGIAAFADLAKPDVKTVVCAPQVPCGAAATKVEQSSGVELKPVSEENDVKSVLSKVSTGNADAGLVYVTDVNAAKGQVQGVSFPESSAAKTNYPIAVVKNAPQADLAQKWVELVTGETGQKTLEAQGFGAA